jgi:hypothetical protein
VRFGSGTQLGQGSVTLGPPSHVVAQCHRLSLEREAYLPKEEALTRRARLLVLLPVLLFAGVASAQHPMLDMAADRVVQRYQQATCEQLSEARTKPKTQQEQDFIAVLRSDAQLRAEFINRVAAPVANKMFTCGLIP